VRTKCTCTHPSHNDKCASSFLRIPRAVLRVRSTRPLSLRCSRNGGVKGKGVAAREGTRCRSCGGAGSCQPISLLMYCGQKRRKGPGRGEGRARVAIGPPPHAGGPPTSIHAPTHPPPRHTHHYHHHHHPRCAPQGGNARARANAPRPRTRKNANSADARPFS
jgi:hypothetical protein